jgi:hypothetical protein
VCALLLHDPRRPWVEWRGGGSASTRTELDLGRAGSALYVLAQVEVVHEPQERQQQETPCVPTPPSSKYIFFN